MSGAGVVAVLGYGTYTGFSMWQGQRQEVGRLVDFGKAVRERCAAEGWKFTLVVGRDEGVPMYVRAGSFKGLKEAAAQLSEGTVTAAVVDSAVLPKLAAKSGPLETVLSVAHPVDAGYSWYLVRKKPAGAVK